MTWAVSPTPSTSLLGYSVLVVDDEWAIALDLELLLSDAGAIVVGPVATVAEGLSLARSEALSAAVLDVRLSGETIEPVAAALADRGIPMLFYSGQLETDVRLRQWAKSAFVPKPAPAQSLVAAVRKLLERDGTADSGERMAMHPRT